MRPTSSASSTSARDPAVGLLATRLQAAESLLAWAAGVVDDVRSEPPTVESVGRAQLAVDQARGHAAEVSVQIASEIRGLGGPSTTGEQYGLDRHWRNTRAHTLHDPTCWRLHHVGEWVLSGKLPASPLG